MGVDLSGPLTGANQAKNWMAYGRFPKSDTEVALEKHFAKFHGIKEGDSFLLGSKALKVVGRIEIKEGSQLAAANCYVLIQTAQKLINKNNASNIAYLTLSDVAVLQDVRKSITRIIPQSNVKSSNSVLESASSIASIAESFSLFISIIIAIVTIMLVIKVTFTTFTERIRDIGILKALGWTNAEIRTELIIESIILNFIGSIVGIFLSIIAVFFISFITIDLTFSGQAPPMSAMQLGFNPSEQSLSFVIFPELFIIAILAVMFIGLISGFLLSRKSLKIRPAEVLRLTL